MFRKSNGFTLIELLAVVILIGIAAAVVIPRIARRPISVRKQFLQNLNILTRRAQLQALTTSKLHRVFFNLAKKRVLIEQVSDKSDSQGKARFKPVTISYVTTDIALPEELVVEKFMLKGKNLLQSGEGIAYTSAWFYITQEGLAQEVSLTMHDTQRDQRFTFTINPFIAQFAE